MKNKYYNGIVKHSLPLASSDRADIMDYLLRTDLVNWYTTYLMKKPLTNELVQEYIQEIWVQIAEIPQAKWDDLYDQGKAAITAFISALIHNNCISVKSKAYRHIRKPKLNEVRLSDLEWEALDEDGTLPASININQNNYGIE